MSRQPTIPAPAGPDGPIGPAADADRAWLVAAAAAGRAAMQDVDAALKAGTIVDITHLTPEQMVKLLIS